MRPNIILCCFSPISSYCFIITIAQVLKSGIHLNITSAMVAYEYENGHFGTNKGEVGIMKLVLALQ